MPTVLLTKYSKYLRVEEAIRDRIEMINEIEIISGYKKSLTVGLTIGTRVTHGQESSIVLPIRDIGHVIQTLAI